MATFEIEESDGCEHKADKTFRGVQEDSKGNPILTMWNCPICHSTVSEPIDFLEKTWKAIQDITERIERLERADKYNAGVLSQLSEKEER